MSTITPQVAVERENGKRTIVGVVTSDKMSKTIVVQTQFKFRHPVFSKVVVKRAKFKAHDEKNEAKIGDTVTIRECRPLSREKRWSLVRVHDDVKKVIPKRRAHLEQGGEKS
jgi:small subunit ribosomal protein S17